MTRTNAAGFASAAIIILLLVLLSMTGGAFYWVAHALDQRDERLSQLTDRVSELAAQRDAKSATGQNAGKLSELEKRLTKLDERLGTLAKTGDSIDELTTRVDELSERVDALAGDIKQARRSDEELQNAVDQAIKDYIAAQQGQGSPSGSDSETANDGANQGSSGFALNATDPVLGNPDAPITIIEYSDMECPYCQRLHQAGTIKQVVDGSDGQVNASFRHFPLASLHGHIAVEAAIAAECVQMNAGDQAFFSMVGAYFKRTGSGGDGIGTPIAEFAAEESGLDKATVRSCMDSDQAMQRVRSDFETGRSNGVNSTPTMIVYNHDTGAKRTVAGSVGADKLQQAVDALTQ